MGRSPCCCHEAGVKKGPWTAEEDQKLVEYIQKHGGHVSSWRSLPKCAGLNRCGKSCRLRWTNYLRPDIKRGEFSDDEERLIIHLHSILGNKWSTIATHLEGRTDNEIKNYWNTHIRKKLLRMGIDPVTHQRRLAELEPAALLSAAASLGSLDSALKQVQVLQQLLQVVNSSSTSISNPLMANIAAASTTFPNYQGQMNTLYLANYPGYFCNVSSVAEQEMVQQLNTTTRSVYSSYAAPAGQYCSTGALVSAVCPEEVAAGDDDRPVQEFAGLEPMELPNLCSLENDLSWKDILESSFLV